MSIVVFTAVLFVLLPSAVLLTIAIVGRSMNRRLMKPRVVQYLPPRGLSLIDAALLTGNDARAIPATLIDLAVQRKVRILAPSDKKTPVAVELLPGAHFTADEQAVLDALFGPGSSTERVRRFSKDKHALSGRVRRVLLAAEKALRAQGLIGHSWYWPGIVVRMFAVIGLLVCLIAIVGTLDEPSVWPLPIALVSVAMIVTTLFLTPKLWRSHSERSAAIREHLAGLNGYITLVEVERFRFLQSPQGALRLPSGITDAGRAVGIAEATVDDPALAFEFDRLVLNERLLPYAVLFGHSREWIAELKTNQSDMSSTEIVAIRDTLEVVAQLVILADAIGNLVNVASAVGEAVEAGGTVIVAVGSVFDGL